MMELIETIQYFIDMVVSVGSFLFNMIKYVFELIVDFISWLPIPLTVAGGVIIVLLIVFRVLGR